MDETTQRCAERVVAAACRWAGVTYALPAPARHGDVMSHIREWVDGASFVQPEDQGFLTSSGRFVGRIEAKRIAQIGGQMINPSRFPELYSEDVW